ncbi:MULTISPECIES: selenium-binding protein SBP56-related protein [Bacteria]|uniref:Selenium-binding protein n=1 Tax=Merismopedia glauca CCAP 1448/3 TaxID=1296344 RepID=A0A2T1C5S2_9CYAN|nr:selenium-binding protein SBP56-related protein [Merismopedia glauca]PSB03611.1 selenium-binding protein [Merismopedia glauca CCAP 1448/3]
MYLKKKFLKLKTVTQAVSMAVVMGVAVQMPSAIADETSCSPFTPLVKGQEDFVYVWTLGVKGLGDESDKLVTVDANPASKSYGKVISKLSVGGRGEAHHMGFTDDRKYMWAGALDSNKIFIFDVATDPSKPKLVKTLNNFVAKSGLVGPHTFYAIPGRMIVAALSNAKDHGGQTGMAIYTNAGEYVSTTMMPTTNGGDGFGYDAAINPNKNAMLTTAFTGWNNYMMDLGKLIKDKDAMKQFGNTTVMWDYKTMKPMKIFNTPGAALEARWSYAPGDNWAVTTTALTSEIYVYKQDDHGEWQQHKVGTIGDPAKIPLPVDISLVSSGKGLWINTFMDGMTRYWDMTDPMHPKETYTKKIGEQVNMVSPSFDGQRVYFTTSLLSNWDMKGKSDDQFLKAYNWDGKDLKLAFEIDFYKEKLGRAHHMKFQARDLKTLQPLQASTANKLNFASNP